LREAENMDAEERRAHWQRIYTTKAETEVSWFEASPEASLAALARAGADPSSAIIDVGGGASRLVDRLVSDGYADVTVLDVSSAAIETAKARLAGAATKVHWLVADATQWTPVREYDVWHDRAAFHFLVDAADQAAYVERLRRALRHDGAAVIATFAPDGPERCSGLAVARHDAASLSIVLGPGFELVDERRYEHKTPKGATQAFQFSIFRRR